MKVLVDSVLDYLTINGLLTLRKTELNSSTWFEEERKKYEYTFH